MENNKLEKKVITNYEHQNAVLLNELIVEINKFLSQNKQEIGSLAEVLKRIFFSGMKCLINVSKISNALH